MGKYKLSKSFTESEKRKAINIIKSGAIDDLSATKIIENLSEKGLTYNRKNELRDIRLAKSFSKGKTPEAREKALKWFDDVYEPFREEKGYTSMTATEKWERARTQSYENLTRAEIDEIVDLRRRYESKF